MLWQPAKTEKSVLQTIVTTNVPNTSDSKNKAGMIVGLTFMAVVVFAAAVGAGWAYKTGRIGGAPRNQQYITEDYEAGPVRSQAVR